MTPINKDITLNNLDCWGSVTELGSEIIEGDVTAYGKMTFGSPADPISSGYFAATKGRFRMIYPFNEHAVVVSGELILTDESNGESKHYKAGDAWFVTKGTPVTWEILTDHFTKHYFAVA